jgi:hypothetical protein
VFYAACADKSKRLVSSGKACPPSVENASTLDAFSNHGIPRGYLIFTCFCYRDGVLGTEEISCFFLRRAKMMIKTTTATRATMQRQETVIPMIHQNVLLIPPMLLAA